MRGFTTGLLTGAALIAGIAVAVNPATKRDIRRLRCNSRRALRGINRTIHRWS